MHLAKKDLFCYKFPYSGGVRTGLLYSPESLFTLTAKVVANYAGFSLRLKSMFNQDQKSVLIKLLGEANFLSASVLNGLAHENLQSLTFVGKKCNKGALFTLSYLSKLEYLNISENTMVSKDLIELFSSLPLLTQLEISNCYHVDDNVLKSLANCSLLKILNLSKCQHFTDIGAEELAENLENLTSLDISFSNVTDMGIEALARARAAGRQHLTELNINGCKNLTCQSTECLKPFEDLDVVGILSVKNNLCSSN